MSAFLTDLFNSIFTPGPTPTLLVATNASFACLQVVLVLLLIATHSIHFLILSVLSAGLWWAINWFVAELKAQAAVETNKKAGTEATSGTDVDTDAETIIDSGAAPPVTGSKAVEPVEKQGELKEVRSSGLDKSEISTEDEWEKVSENENEKDK